jgi:hypothetical protein
MTFQGGDFGEERHDEAKQPSQAPEARPWEEFAPPAYAGQPPPQPQPNAPQGPPPSAPVPPWNPPTSDYPRPGYPPLGGYGPPGYQDAPPYGAPSYPPPPPPPPPYGQSYPPPGYGGGYGSPPGYPGPYDPYHPYLDRSHETNGLAIGSLVTSIVGLLLGGPLTFFCYLGLLIPVVGVVLGMVALNQIKRTNQQGRGLAIAGIAVGATAVVLLVLIVIAIMASSVKSPMLR